MLHLRRIATILLFSSLMACSGPMLINLDTHASVKDPSASSSSQAIDGIPVPSGTTFNDGSLSFSAGNKDLVVIKSTEDGGHFMLAWEACAANHPAGWYNRLRKAFAKTTIHVYEVHNGIASSFLYLAPNAAHHTSLLQLKEDFLACEAGALTPILFNQSIILFEMSCGDEGCDRIKSAIQPSLHLL